MHWSSTEKTSPKKKPMPPQNATKQHLYKQAAEWSLSFPTSDILKTTNDQRHLLRRQQQSHTPYNHPPPQHQQHAPMTTLFQSSPTSLSPTSSLPILNFSSRVFWRLFLHFSTLLLLLLIRWWCDVSFLFLCSLCIRCSATALPPPLSLLLSQLSH